jgi:hypothetical protein
MVVTTEKKAADFSQPVEANFIVALKAKNGKFCLYVEAFTRHNGKDYLKHTTKIEEAKRFSRFTAEDVVERVKEYRCTGRVEKVSSDNARHEPVDASLESIGNIKSFFGAKTVGTR